MCEREGVTVGVDVDVEAGLTRCGYREVILIQLVGWSVGQLVSWSVGQLVSWSVGWSVGWLVGRRDLL
jgi:hypothetical protein